MSLLDYEKRFSALRMNNTRGRASPHKVALLLAVIDLIESEKVEANQFFFDGALKDAFTVYFDTLASGSDRNNPHLPFFHLRGDGFWHHKIRPGKQSLYAGRKTITSSTVLNELIQYAYFDDELFELMGNRIARELLKSSLRENLDEAAVRALIKPESGGWDWLECEFLVGDYMAMLARYLRGEAYNKAEDLRTLRRRLDRRSVESIKDGQRNVSAVLIEMGMPYIPGYKPDFNYPRQLEQVVLSYLAGQPSFVDEIAQTADAVVNTTADDSIPWGRIFDPNPPTRIPRVSEARPAYLAKRVDFSERERRNRKLGSSAEAFIYKLEKERLTQEGRPDLAAEVEWSSRDRGDGLGFDIHSFNALNDEERFIEVKATHSGKYQPFFISENERAFSNDYAEAFRLYRVYEFGTETRLFVLRGPVEHHVHLIPKNYQARF